MCRGTGARWTGWTWVECADCQGTGRVKHCVACGGRGKLWLGGREYVDCPECPSALGGVRPASKRYVVMSGLRFERVRIR